MIPKCIQYMGILVYYYVCIIYYINLCIWRARVAYHVARVLVQRMCIINVFPLSDLASLVDFTSLEERMIRCNIIGARSHDLGSVQDGSALEQRSENRLSLLDCLST